jgi:pimeloyl-ACP methyl ester carboxylesterase
LRLHDSNVFTTGLTSLSVTLPLGHGESPRPKKFAFWGLKQYGADLKAGLDYVRTLDPTAPPPVVVGHSSGGGLSQWVIQNTDVRVSGLICVGAIPPFGGLRVYKNWWTTDLFFYPRALWHGGDMRSALSTPELVRRIFFSPQLSEERLKDFFEGNLNHEESMNWPMEMMVRFVQPLVVRSKIPGRRVFWVAGEHDVLVDPVITKDAAAEYGADMAVVKGAGQWSFSHLVLLPLNFWIRPSYAE